jgi:EthD domain
MFVRFLLIVLVAFPLAGHAQAPAQQSPSAQKTVWYFYKVKWGFQDEFQSLFARNHLPVLREQIKSGRIASVRTFVPSYHGDGRSDWTFAVAIVFKDVAAFVSPSNDEEIQKRLYPDRAKFLKEEQRRFEILEAHWDVPLNELDLK